MNVIIPMAGAGKRFTDAGFTTSKPLILTTDWRTGEKIPMVTAAVKDIADKDSKVIFITRDFHRSNNFDKYIYSLFPRATFIESKTLTEGQASTCLLAKELINNEEELLIGGCDNGQIFNRGDFFKLKSTSDALIFTYRNHPHVEENAAAYGWVRVQPGTTRATAISVKTPLSSSPMDDHAIVATFWFKHGRDFVRCAEDMILANDRINNEFYVDQVMNYAIKRGLNVNVFEVEKYFSWGNPVDYSNYEATYAYWSSFFKDEQAKKNIV